jgi:hypothetical protein
VKERNKEGKKEKNEIPPPPWLPFLLLSLKQETRSVHVSNISREMSLRDIIYGQTKVTACWSSGL